MAKHFVNIEPGLLHSFEVSEDPLEKVVAAQRLRHPRRRRFRHHSANDSTGDDSGSHAGAGSAAALDVGFDRADDFGMTEGRGMDKMLTSDFGAAGAVSDENADGSSGSGADSGAVVDAASGTVGHMSVEDFKESMLRAPRETMSNDLPVGSAHSC